MKMYHHAFRTRSRLCDPDYAALGIPQAEGLAPSTASVPVATIDTSERLSTPSISPTPPRQISNAAPCGTTGGEIWVKIDGPPPGNESDCSFLALDTTTPYVAEYTPRRRRQDSSLSLTLAIDGRIENGIR